MQFKKKIPRFYQNYCNLFAIDFKGHNRIFFSNKVQSLRISNFIRTISAPDCSKLMDCWTRCINCIFAHQYKKDKNRKRRTFALPPAFNRLIQGSLMGIIRSYSSLLASMVIENWYLRFVTHLLGLQPTSFHRFLYHFT